MTSSEEWEQATREYPLGATVRGTVFRVEPFGVFFRIEGCTVPFLILAPEFSDPRAMRNLEDYPQVGEQIEGRVIDHAEYNHQIRVTARPRLNE